MNTDNLDTRQRYGAIAAITKTLTELIETLPDGEQLQTIENTTIDTLCDCHAFFLPKDLFNAIASEATALALSGRKQLSSGAIGPLTIFMCSRSTACWV